MSTPTLPEDATGPVAALNERRLGTDAGLMLGAKVLVLILGAATTVIVARSLGPSGRGSLAAAYALMTLLAQLGTLGIASANPYYAARDPHARGGIAANSLWLGGVFGSTMIVAGLGLKLVAPGALSDVGWPEVAVAVGAVPIVLSSLFLQSILLAEGRMLVYNGTDVATALLTVILLLTVLPLDRTNVLLALVLMIGPQAGALFVYLWAMRRHGRVLRRPDTALARRMMGYGLRAYVVTLLAYLLIRIDLLLVNGIQGSKAAGQYSIAVALADGLYLLPISVSVNMFARVARGAERELSIRVFQLVAVVYLVVCVIAGALAGPAIHVLFGPAYHPAVSLFLWLLPGVYFLGVLNVIAYHFAGHGLPKELALVWIPGLAINLAIDLTLLPHHGTYIASISSSVAYGIVLVLHLRMFARWLGGWSILRPSVTGTAAAIRLALRRR